MKLSNRPLLRRPRFLLERWVQRGVLNQLLLMASLVAVVAVIGGIAAKAMTPAFETLSTAIWWSFLRLTDPGYLGDDEGAALRVISTIVTVLGYVLFMGSLIAIMTQWLAQTIRNLENGLTPIVMDNHFVILGWTNRTPEIIRKLVTAGGRLERFFALRSGSSKLRVVILTEEVDAQRRLELRDSLGDDWSESQIFLRSGSSLQQEHLERLDLRRAAVVMIPGADFALGGAELTDTRVVKTLLTLDVLFRQGAQASTPKVVAELFDPKKVSIAQNAISVRTEIIAGDRLISGLLSQSLRHPGVAAVLLQLLRHREGNALYLRAFPEFVGMPPRALIHAFPEAVVLGIVSMEAEVPTAHFVKMDNVVLKDGDLLILLAESYGQCQPAVKEVTQDQPPCTRLLPPLSEPEHRQLLILGWSYKIPTLLTELLESNISRFDVTIVSKVDENTRNHALSHLNLTERIHVKNVEGDYSLAHDLHKIHPHRFNHILFMASGWMQSSEEADARTILGFLLLRSMLKKDKPAPQVFVELLDPDNARILGEAAAEVVLVSPRVLSHLLAHVGLRPELNAVYNELICAGGAEIELRPMRDIGIETESVTFTKVQLKAADLGCVALGFFTPQESVLSQQLHLNPERNRRWILKESDAVILLTPGRDGQLKE